MSLYLYGIVSRPRARRADGVSGIGAPPRPLQAIPNGGVAALVSAFADSDGDTVHLLQPTPADPAQRRTHLRALRRDMRVHAAVLNQLAETTTVLPARFGIVVPDEQTLLRRILSPQQAVFQQHLE